LKKLLVLAACCLVFSAAAVSQNKYLDPLWSASTAAFPGKGQFTKPVRWAAGQYVTTGTTISGKRDSVARTLIVGKEGANWVVETWSMDRKGKETVSQMCLSGMDQAMTAGNAGGIELIWFKSLEKGVVEKMEGDSLIMIKTIMKSSWENMVVNVSTYTDGGAVQVAAGSFAGTSYNKATVTVMGFKVQTEVWYHPAVIVNGMVKSKSSDGKTITELLAFGNDGKPKLP